MSHQDPIKKLVQKGLKDGVYTALQLSVANKSRVIYQNKFGAKYKYFDLASTTKLLVTTPLMIILCQEGKVKLEDRVSEYLPLFDRHPLGKIKIKALLNQTSGLEWWKPFYKTLVKHPPFERDFILRKLFLREKVRKISTCVYSDLNFIMLQWIIEAVMQMPIDVAFTDKISGPLELENTFYIRLTEKNRREPKRLFAPTEKTKARGIVQGSVHDDNCESFGGVSGHTGLFSTLEETTVMAQNLLRAPLAEKGAWHLFDKNEFQRFIKRSVPKKKGDWALGFMVPSRPISTGGSKISTESFGFPGFTGPSIWIDTKRELAVTILANRTYPDRNNPHFAAIRRELHDIIWENSDGK